MPSDTEIKIIIPEGQSTYILTDRLQILRATKAGDMAGALFEILVNLRKRCLWEAESVDEDVYDAMVDGIELVMDKIWDIANSYGIDIEQLME